MSSTAIRSATIPLAAALVFAGCAADSDGLLDASSEAPDGSPLLDGGGVGDGLAGDAGGPGTGFWRIARPADSERTWLVDPDGNRVFLLGVNTVLRDSKRGTDSRCEGIDDYLGRHHPSTVAHVEWARLSTGESGGFSVPRPYGFNSAGAFSQTNDLDDTGGRSYLVRGPEGGGADAPYSEVVTPSPRGDDRALKDESGEVLESGLTGTRVGDPYNPAFVADVDARYAERVAPHRDDPRLQMWFLGNEIGIFDKGSRGEGVRDFRRWIWSDCPAGSDIDEPQCAPHALLAFLRERHGSIGALNEAWGSAYASFSAIAEEGPRPVPYEQACNLACREDLQRFVHDGLLREWVRVVTTRLRAVDPNHLVATPRLALGNANQYRFYAGASSDEPDIWVDSGNAVGTDTDSVSYSPFDLLGRDGDAGFDVVAVNVYTGASNFERPWFTDGIHEIQRQSGLPVFVSEFGVRTRIDGWSNRGGAGSFVDTQAQRGERYRSQIEQLAGFRHIIGASWHAWSDRYMPDDESLQINMGLVQCADPARGFEAGARWGELDERVAETNAAIMDIIAERTGL